MWQFSLLCISVYQDWPTFFLLRNPAKTHDWIQTVFEKKKFYSDAGGIRLAPAQVVPDSI